MQIKKENNQVVISLSCENENAEVIDFLKLIEHSNTNYLSQNSSFYELIKQFKKEIPRTIVEGKIQIFDQPLLNNYQEPLVTLDGYKDEINQVFGLWYGDKKASNQWIATAYGDKIEIRTNARKNQSIYSNDYKVVKTYYYKCI